MNALKDNTAKNTNKDCIFKEKITVDVPGKRLINECDFTIIRGQKYGLVGKNGEGKSQLLHHITTLFDDVFYVGQEFNYDKDKTIFHIVLDANQKRAKLLKRLEELNNMDDMDLEEYNKITDILKQNNYTKDESIIRKILYGLGFSLDQQNLSFSHFSGGWKMRVALARGLYMKPTLLLLDEPTNHLDLDALIWLSDYLSNVWKKTLIIVSHDVYFLNMCTNIIHLENKTLTFYQGNYDNFTKQYALRLHEMTKKWNQAQKDIKSMRKKNVSKEKVDNFIKLNAHHEPPKPYVVKIKFKQPQHNNIKLSLEDVSFGYDKLLFSNVNINLYNNDKITIVGANGCGKTSMLNIITGRLKPTNGVVKKEDYIKVGVFNQHSTDELPKDITPVSYLVNKGLVEFDARKILGNVGLVGKLHLHQIGTLSGGQKARVALAELIVSNPDILLLDEVTNNLDIISISSLINTINNFEGIVIMISHNIDLIRKTNSYVYKLEKNQLLKIDFDDYYDDVLDKINI